ncbi:MAG: bifunctional adenosylcobinamide kinase/adenosylcobinamide-phosphate guanylyltransferase [Ruminococcus sp.]|nr:bifunctional adenosylcobinamide kinase/adenosylcobinamide-phosphate guanylyltransferase [Ruminococcus sp.]
MTTLVTGGSKCGKSGFAENYLHNFGGRKYYIATMRPYGEEALRSIGRHRSMRAEKNFVTVEKYTDLHELEFPENSAVLLECAGNLLANEMFSGKDTENPVEKILNAFRKISENVSEFVIVSNEVSSDGIVYSEETMRYMRFISEINAKTAEFADNVVECVFGIPIVIKGALK